MNWNKGGPSGKRGFGFGGFSLSTGKKEEPRLNPPAHSAFGAPGSSAGGFGKNQQLPAFYKIGTKRANFDEENADVCPCLMTPADNSSELMALKLINQEYQTELERLISGQRYDGHEDFTVVLQPYLQNTTIPSDKDGNPDLSYFTLDCFHFSERAQAEMAISLWNNMLEPVGNKQTFNNFTYDRTKLKCPTETLRPFIYTKMNSHPDYFTTSTSTPVSSTPVSSTAVSSTPAPCTGGVPVWVPAIFGVAGLILGWGVTWLFMRRFIKKQKNEAKVRERETEIKGTSF
ncbi:phospholipase B1, membrane-associated [Silurus asotus]|uniref:Phospholipase B1, membrane-associated n=1 Tax=Silurus asotus TaxID=30991 RepID=A0AAD5A8K0_SILAS|nr:phospholipase B1, membrane-associated [Silurus asotus]